MMQKPTINLADDWIAPVIRKEGENVTLIFDDGDSVDVTSEQLTKFQSLLKSGETIEDELDNEIVISLKAQQYLYELIDDYHVI